MENLDVFDISEKRPNNCILEEFDGGQSALIYDTLNCRNEKYNQNHESLHKDIINACSHQKYHRSNKICKKKTTCKEEILDDLR